jgi:hydroxymethylpyrimidine/phosphomethylpyrimidine kinase
MTPIALTIAGSDSSAGAGIQADLKTFAALGVYGASVITALTAQNTAGVFATHDVPAKFVGAQLNAVFSDLNVAAVKIGMVSSRAAIKAIADGLDRWRDSDGVSNVVLDPIIAASSGAPLLAPDALDALKRLLMPRARLVTPNLDEAAALLDAPVARDESAMREQGGRLLALGPQAVLIKGGHASGVETVDLLIERATVTRLAAERIVARNTHGTGCTFAAAIAAGLAKGEPLADAARAAKSYVTAALAAADQISIGSGHGPLNHFHAWWHPISKGRAKDRSEQ